MLMYVFAKEFGYTPNQIRDLDIQDYIMLSWGIKKSNDEQQKQQNKGNKINPKGGSYSNGQQMNSSSDLLKQLGVNPNAVKKGQEISLTGKEPVVT